MSLSSTTIFHFLLRKVFETYQVYYTILLIAFEFASTFKHIFCHPKQGGPQNFNN